MTATCPGCTARYALPPSLLGPGGARVRCPACGERFVVTGPEAALATETIAAAGAWAQDPVLDGALVVLASRASAIAAARDRGALFDEHGASICDAFEAYAAAGGDAARFRVALAERFGVSLPATEGR